MSSWELPSGDSCPALRRAPEELCVRRSCAGLLAWDRTQVAVACGCTQVSAVPAPQGGRAAAGRAEERLHETLLSQGVTSPSATEVLVGRNQFWQADSWKRTGNWCRCPQSPPCWSSGSHGNAAKPPCSRKTRRRTGVCPGDMREMVVPNHLLQEQDSRAPDSYRTR